MFSKQEEAALNFLQVAPARFLTESCWYVETGHQLRMVSQLLRVFSTLSMETVKGMERALLST